MNNTEKLVYGLKIASTGVLSPLEKEYPVLSSILSNSPKPLDNWRFFMVAGGVVYFILNANLAIREIYKLRLAKTDKELALAVDDLLKYLDTVADNSESIDLKTKIGFWVLWAIKEKELTLEEAEALPSIIGNYLAKVASDFM